MVSGIVERIEDKTILGTTCGFYHLRIVANETTVLVPVSNVDGVGLRRAISDEEVERLFGLLGDGKIDNHQNWKGRFKDNSDKMRSGSIYEVADVLKSLTFLAKSKSLSFREKRMLDRAKFLIISEVSEVMRETAAAIEGRVDGALERCFTAKARTAAARRQGGQGRAARAAGGRRSRRRARARRSQSGIRTQRQHQSIIGRRVKARRVESPAGFFVYDPRRCSSPPSAPSRPIVAVSLYVLVAGADRHAAGAALRLEGSAVYASAMAACASASRSCGIRYRVAGAEHLPLDRAAVYCCEPPEQRRSADPLRRRCIRGCTSSTSTRSIAIPILARAFRHGRVHPDRPPQQGSGDAIDRGGRAVDPGGQLVPDLSGRHPQHDRRAAAVQEGRLHHGDQGAGADRAGRDPGRPGAMQRGSGSSGPSRVSIRVGAPIETVGIGHGRS